MAEIHAVQSIFKSTVRSSPSLYEIRSRRIDADSKRGIYLFADGAIPGSFKDEFQFGSPTRIKEMRAAADLMIDPKYFVEVRFSEHGRCIEAMQDGRCAFEFHGYEYVGGIDDTVAVHG